MPYAKDHKARTRARIVEAARKAFNRDGYDAVSIDQLMSEAGLTRGGFYAHFRNKEEVFAAATLSFLEGRGAKWREDAGVDPTAGQVVMAQRMVRSYLSAEHLGDLEGQCPLIAYATDVARAGPQVRESYARLLEAMVWLFEGNIEPGTGRRERALSLAALCVGGMILARSLPDKPIAEEVRLAALSTADALWAEGDGAEAA